MSADAASVPLEDLLAHRAWVRALALALTRDENEADDVEQETWAAALRSPPAEGTSQRGWLRTVARNSARRRHRTRERTRRREGAAARSDSVSADPAELTARAELHARVAAAVVALGEPYRRAVLLRYFEGLAVAAVAERMGAPLETTRARLRRGRDQLRERLAGDAPEGRPLALVLLPLLGDAAGRSAGAGGAAVAAAGGTIMATKVMAAGLALALVAGGIWWGATRGRDPSVSAAAPQVAEAPQPAVADETTATAPPERARVRPPRPNPEDEPPAAAPDAQRPSITELLAQRIPSLELEDVSLRRGLAIVSGQTGIPVYVDVRAVQTLEQVGGMTLRLSDVEARGALQIVARLSNLRVEVEEERVVVVASDAEWDASLPAERIEPVVPDPDAPRSLLVRGRVLDAERNLAEGVAILHGPREVGRSGADGEFAVELTRPLRWLTARRPGAQDAPRFAVAGEYGDELEAELVLGPPAAAVLVAVSGEDGAPVPDASVQLEWAADADPIVRADGIRTTRWVSESLRTDDAGDALHESIAPGGLRVKVSKKGHVPVTQMVDVVAGERARVEVTLRAVGLEERLRTERVTFSFADTPFHQTIEYLSAVRGLPIVIGPTAMEASPGPVTLDVRDDTAENALRALCDAAGDLTFEIRDGVVLVKARERK